MFGLGLYESIAIIIAAIIFLKPHDYPKIAKKIAKLVRKVNLFWSNLINQIDLYD